MSKNNGIEVPKKVKYKKVNAPFGYFGSKNKIAFRLCKELPPHNCWVEVFCGSASLTLAKPPAQLEVINDIDGEIVNFFQQLRDNQTELCRLVALTPYSPMELENARNCQGDTPIERARSFLVQSMMAINGVFGSDKGGFSSSNSYTRNGKEARVSRWYNLPDRLADVAERLRSTRIENRDALDVITKFENRPASLLYLDPPYLGKRANGYKFDANDPSFHEEMLTLSTRAKCMIFISGYENDLYNDLLTEGNGWTKKTIPTETKGTNGESKERTEVVWMNRQFTQAKESGQIPIELTEKETKHKKVNPERVDTN